MTALVDSRVGSSLTVDYVFEGAKEGWEGMKGLRLDVRKIWTMMEGYERSRDK